MRTKTTTIERVRGRDLPPEWAKRAGVDPDELLQVIIGPSREQAVEELIGLMDEIGEEAQRRRLTEEKLKALLKDD